MHHPRPPHQQPDRDAGLVRKLKDSTSGNWSDGGKEGQRMERRMDREMSRASSLFPQKEAECMIKS